MKILMVVFLLAMISVSISIRRKTNKIIAMKHRPLIAILNNKKVDNKYIDWIRSGGADVVTACYTDSNVSEVINKANGAVMLYSERETNQSLFNITKDVYKEIKNKNKEYYYPIIAIGEGCNVVQLAEMNMTDTIQYGEYDEKKEYKIHFINDNISRTKLFFYFDGRDLLSIKNMTFSMKTNHSGFDVATYTNDEDLIKSINPIGYIQHESDKVVTLLEGKKVPLVGMLFDIAKYIYEDKNKEIKENMITIGQKILNFIIKEAYDGLLSKQAMIVMKNHMNKEKENDNIISNENNRTKEMISQTEKDKEKKKINIIEVMKENRNETIFKKIRKEIRKYIENTNKKKNHTESTNNTIDVNVTELAQEDEIDLIHPNNTSHLNNTNDTELNNESNQTVFNKDDNNSTLIRNDTVNLTKNKTEVQQLSVSNATKTNNTKNKKHHKGKKSHKAPKSNNTTTSNKNKTEIDKLIKKSNTTKKKGKKKTKNLKKK